MALGLLAVGGCKKHRPPDLTRIWLGKYHGCAVVKNGGLECWGANDVGQLGDGTKQQSTLPVKSTAGAVTDLAIGARHTCAIMNGQISCWGDASHGQLAAPAVRGVTRLDAAGNHTCANGDDGLVCWGEGPTYTGHGKVAAFAVGTNRVCAAMVEPKRVECTESNPVLVGVAVKQLSLGGGHACALLEDGSVQCWGKNDSGQVGDGTTTDVPLPVLVGGLPAAVEVRAGERHTCARMQNNTVGCWGNNELHQLANGTLTPSARPYPVVGLVGVFELAVGGDSSCARLSEGGARCWGSNVAGQLGDGTIQEHPVPMPIHASR